MIEYIHVMGTFPFFLLKQCLGGILCRGLVWVLACERGFISLSVRDHQNVTMG